MLDGKNPDLSRCCRNQVEEGISRDTTEGEDSEAGTRKGAPENTVRVAVLDLKNRGRVAAAQPGLVSGPETDICRHKGTSETNRQNLSHVSMTTNGRHESWGPTIKGKNVGERTKIVVDWEVDKDKDGALSLKEKGF